uniref:CCHC-type domain-containing protein n=1 Tax=Brassica oleracea var. oleracea TaxID=109376 RepID=A0A0D3CQX8_BRAOL
MHKYESVKEGPKPNDIIQFMRNDHGVEISYSLAWDAREYAVNVPLTIAVEKKIDRRIEKGKKFQVSLIGDDRHAIKAAFSVGKQALTLIDDMYTTASWRSVYEETINPISVPEDSWIVPSHVKQAKVLPPESRRGASRRKKRRYEKVEDKIRSSQGTQRSKRRKCSRCGMVGHNRSTCDRAI